jgi:hypothetical protein
MHLLLLNTSLRNSTWSMDFLLTQALQRAGIQTTCFDYIIHEYRLATELAKYAGDFDAVLLQRGTGYSIPASLLRALRRPRFFLFTELVARHPRQHYLLQSNLFDHVFLRSWTCIETVTQQGWLPARQVSLALSAAEPTLHRPLQPYMREQDKDIDVLFVGAAMPRRRVILDQLGRDFTITVRAAYGEEMVTLINRAKIVLNLHAEEHLDTETRVYEVLASKGFLITEKLASESPFTSRVHLVEAGDVDDLRQQIAYYLAHPDERAQMAQAGYHIVTAHHTYTYQAQQVLDIIQPEVERSPTRGAALDTALLRQAQAEELRQRMILPLRRTLGPLRLRLRQLLR